MLYVILALAVSAIALVLLQQYAVRKLKGGFSLRDHDGKPRKRLFADPEEEAVRKWLESDDGDELPPPDDA